MRICGPVGSRQEQWATGARLDGARHLGQFAAGDSRGESRHQRAEPRLVDAEVRPTTMTGARP